MDVRKKFKVKNKQIADLCQLFKETEDVEERNKISEKIKKLELETKKLETKMIRRVHKTVIKIDKKKMLIFNIGVDISTPI